MKKIILYVLFFGISLSQGVTIFAAAIENIVQNQVTKTARGGETTYKYTHGFGGPSIQVTKSFVKRVKNIACVRLYRGMQESYNVVVAGSYQSIQAKITQEQAKEMYAFLEKRFHGTALSGFIAAGFLQSLH